MPVVRYPILLSLEHVSRVPSELKLHLRLSELLKLVFKLSVLAHHVSHDVLLELLLVLCAVLVGFIKVVIGSFEVLQFLPACSNRGGRSLFRRFRLLLLSW